MAEDIFIESTRQKALARHGALEASALFLNARVKWICATVNGKYLKLKTQLGENAAWAALGLVERQTHEVTDMPYARE